MNTVPLDRESMFKYSDVHCRANATDIPNLVCYECKLNNGQDYFMESLPIAARIAHLETHKRSGHKISEWQLKSWKMQKEIEDRAVKIVTIHYAISNNGDGSASVHFFKTAEAAEKFDEAMEEGWGEPCNDSKTLYFDKDGVLINSDDDEDDI